MGLLLRVGLHQTRLIFPGTLLLVLSSRAARLTQQRGGRAVASMYLLPTTDSVFDFLTIHLFSSPNFTRSSTRQVHSEDGFYGLRYSL